MTTDLTWTRTNQHSALQEGWDIFECGDTEHEPFELCKLDDPGSLPELGLVDPVFDDDTDVWEHVIARATLGCFLHNKALAFLMQESPGELIHIAMFLSDNGASCLCLSCNRPEAE